MEIIPDILTLAYKYPIMYHELDPLLVKEKQIPQSIQYNISRFRKKANWNIEDTGMFCYYYHPSNPDLNFIELKFCLLGNVYCAEKATECNQCKVGLHQQCESRINSVDVLSFRFMPTHLQQFALSKLSENERTDAVLNFKHPTSFYKVLQLCHKTRTILESILANEYDGMMENIYVNAQSQMLLLYSLECIAETEPANNKVETFTCKFLANEVDREKIYKARDVLLQHIGEPITIKELSRKVAINECYLKKGFKELFGSTVFDFYQTQRMEHARYLLYEKGLSVTEVSIMLGYSSISHFSTAFKKHTGIKPCELLLH